MVHALPLYAPPGAQRAGVAAGTAPLIVLLAFTLLVTRVIDHEVCFAWFAGCTFWVSYEMVVYQRTIDSYNAEFVRRHLAWRSTDVLRALAGSEGTPEPTREFVLRFLGTNRLLFPERPTL